MKHPTISRLERRSSNGANDRESERGVTMVLVATALVAIMAMAALSIDVVTLYLANAESQRSADAAALAAARILSIYGVTGDPTNSAGYWGTATAAATQVAQNVANQNVVGGTVPSSVLVTFPQGGGPAFGVNPIVQVQVQRSNLPTFFSRIWGNRSAIVSATATAEAFNPSGSAAYPAGMVTVQPRCVKPWLVGNGTPPNDYVDPDSGAITNFGIQLNYANGAAITVGSRILLQPPGPSYCTATDCLGARGKAIAQNNYIAASVQPTPVAVASGATGDLWQDAIAGCDQTTVYACGTAGGATADLTVNLGKNNGDTYNATQTLISSGDTIVPTTYPFQIRAGFSNPLVTAGIVNDDDVISSSNSIATIPLIDSRLLLPPASTTPNVTVVGFLQLFIEQVDPTTGIIHGTALNVSGCGTTGTTASVTGSSPVPVRLISP
ncbi:MAG TPA: pilus assembly protein TadG-related protein [Candidatus Sulfotelmatobacter sp.]